MKECEQCGLFHGYLCPLHAEERERELEARAAGKLDGAASKRHEELEARSLAGRWRPTVAAALEEEARRKRGRPSADGYRSWLEAIGEKGRNQVAFLTLNFVAKSLLRSAEDEPEGAEKYPLASSVGQELADRLFKDRDLRGAYGGNAKAGYRRSIGARLISCMESSTDLIVLETRRGGPKSNGTYIRPTEALWQESHEYHQWVRPLHPPMVVVPHPWTDGPGGYRYDLAGEPDLGATDAPRVVRAALDRLQKTAWQINRPVLDLVRAALDKDDPETAGRVRQLLRIPADPPEWALRANQRRAVQQMAKIRLVCDTLAVAEECLEPETRFYLPHRLDWRGRIYSAVEHLNPQGGDLARALLLFADGKPIGKAGARRLAIHGANSFGIRGTLEARVAWTEEHTEAIEGAAADPLSSDLLREARERFQFYAFALEWAQYGQHVRSGCKPGEFVSRLPCGQDHTCSGVQHIAALWRNETLARASNVLPGEPRDFYQEVTDKVVQELEDRAGDGVEQARLWLKVKDQIITRSLIKKFAMTFDYGATSFGFGADIGAYVREQAKDDPELRKRQPMYWPDAVDVFEPESGPPVESDWRPPRKEEEREALRHRYETGDPWAGDDPELLKVLDEALDQYELSVIGTANNYLAQITERVLDQLTEARDWFRACAKAVAETNSPVSWTVPITGFEVVQNGWNYMKTERDGRPRAGKRQLVTLKLTDDVLPLKQRNGAAPNVIHSLDAANLVLTIGSLPEELPLGTAHDCYYTLAADADRVNQAARAAFVQLRRESILDKLHAHFSALAGRELPKPPKGELALEATLDSQYLLS